MLCVHFVRISIHAPLTGCDSHEFYIPTLCCFISIHAPLTGCDSLIPAPSTSGTNDFNPRTPHGVRHCKTDSKRKQSDFNPRTPHGVRLRDSTYQLGITAISIHAPLTGCECFVGPLQQTEMMISIHAPLTGCDPRTSTGYVRRDVNFNPRTPHGVRPWLTIYHKPCFTYFNPRTPHGVRLEYAIDRPTNVQNFNPRTPHGVRQGKHTLLLPE